MPEAVEQLRTLARELLTSGAVKAVVGYGAGSSPERTRPLIVTCAERANELVWNKYCHNNLALYLTRAEVTRLGKVAVVLKGCDARVVVGLIQEGQLLRENAVLIGMACDGMGEPLWTACAACDAHTPKFCDHVIGSCSAGIPPARDIDLSKGADVQAGSLRYGPVDAEVARIEALPLDKRWEFWREQFSRCVKCYACRQVCPLCYCKRCVAEKNQPQWVATSAHEAGNFSWHMVRALHLAGRCIGCGACERACPQDIPLSLLNRKLALSVARHFDYRPGLDPAAVPAVKTFDKKDPNEFFR